MKTLIYFKNEAGKIEREIQILEGLNLVEGKKETLFWLNHFDSMDLYINQEEKIVSFNDLLRLTVNIKNQPFYIFFSKVGFDLNSFLETFSCFKKDKNYNLLSDEEKIFSFLSFASNNNALFGYSNNYIQCCDVNNGMNLKDSFFFLMPQSPLDNKESLYLKKKTIQRNFLITFADSFGLSAAIYTFALLIYQKSTLCLLSLILTVALCFLSLYACKTILPFSSKNNFSIKKYAFEFIAMAIGLGSGPFTMIFVMNSIFKLSYSNIQILLAFSSLIAAIILIAICLFVYFKLKKRSKPLSVEKEEYYEIDI